MKYIKTLILIVLLIPSIAFGVTPGSWFATSTDKGFIYTNLINGNLPSVLIGTTTGSNTTDRLQVNGNVQIGNALFGGVAPFAGLGTSYYQQVISQNVDNLAGQLYLANLSTGINATTCQTFGNANSTNGGAASKYIAGICFAGPNFATAGFGALTPNGLAVYNVDGNYIFGTATSSATAAIVNGYAGNNGGFAQNIPDWTLRPLIGGTGVAFNGIGTTTPFGMLSVNPNMLGSGNPEFVVGSSTATHFIVDGAGNVGIGTTSPSQLLSTYSNAPGVNPTIQVSSGVNSSFPVFQIRDGRVGGNTWNLESGRSAVGTFDIFNSTVGQVLTILSGGSVGIGSTSPATTVPLTVQTSSAGSPQLANFAAPSMSANSSAYITIGKAIGTSNSAVIGYMSLTNPVAFITNFGDNQGVGVGLFVQKGGNVGIGTTTPVRKLHVTNTGANDQFILEDSSASTGQHYGSIGFSRGTMSFNQLTDNYATTSRMIIDPMGEVGIGSTTPWAKLTVQQLVSETGNLFAIATTTAGGVVNTSLLVDGNGILSTAYGATLGTPGVLSTTTINGGLSVGNDGTMTATSIPTFQVLSNAPGTKNTNGLMINGTSAAGSGVILQATSTGPNEAIIVRSLGTGSTILDTLSTTGTVLARIAGVSRWSVGSVTTASTNTLQTFTSIAGSSLTSRFTFTGTADTSLGAGSEATDMSINLAQTRQHLTGTTIALQRDLRILPSAHSFSAFDLPNNIITNHVGVSIEGTGSAGTNALISTSTTLMVAGGTLNASTTKGVALAVYAGTGARFNYSAIFQGGNVGIGTSTPRSLLTIGNTDMTSASQIEVGTTANQSNYALGISGGRAMIGYDLTNSSLNLEAGSSKGVSIYVNQTNDVYATGGTPSVFVSGGAVGFGTSGFVGFASTTPWRTVSINGSMAVSGLSATAVGDNFVCINPTTKEITFGATCSASTLKVKENIETLDNSLSTFLKLDPRTFNYKKGYYDGKKDIGFIAEEVNKVDPRLAIHATEDSVLPDGQKIKKDDPVAINTNAILSVTVGAVKALNDKIDKLPQYAGEAKKSATDNWQYALIGLLALGFIYQQRQIMKLKNK